MPLPNILEFIGNNVTQAGFKAAQEKLLNFLIGEAATKVELSAALTPKADKTYVDTALSSFQNGAIKTYPTLAAANADIANIALNTKVSVLSAEDGGDYYKASSSATSLTKSDYDPLTQAKNYTDTLLFGYVSIVDRIAIEKGYILSNTGVKTSLNSSWSVTDFIEATDKKFKYKLQSYQNATTPRISIATYDSSQNYIATILTATSTDVSTFEGEFEAGSASYIRVSFYNENSIFELSVKEIFETDDFKSSVNSIIAPTLVTKIESFIVEASAAVDILESSNIKTAFVVTTSGGTVSTNANWSTTDLFEVTEGDEVYYELQSIKSSLSASMINGYDSSGSFVCVLVQPNSTSLTTYSGTVTIPAGVTQIRISFYTLNSIYSASIGSTVFLQDDFKSKIKTIANETSKYQDKVLITLGDSITDHHTNSYTYPPIVAKELGMTLIDGAKSGRRIRDAFYRTDLITTEAIQSANIITIAHGTNDFKLETALGTINDAATNSTLFFDSTYTATTNKTDGTFYADYKGVIEYIMSLNVNARIMLITPIRRTQVAATGTDTNAKGFKLKAYAEAVQEIAEYYALPCLDNFNTSGFNAMNLTALTLSNDGLHPNNWAQENIMAKKISGFIISN